jgi:hypothetical protein
MAHGKPRSPAPAPDRETRTREMAMRRSARRHGYTATKIRRYDASAPDWNTWLLHDAKGRLVPGLFRTVNGVLIGASLADAERFLGIARDEQPAQDAAGDEQQPGG